jgi:hypothetical protein
MSCHTDRTFEPMNSSKRRDLSVSKIRDVALSQTPQVQHQTDASSRQAEEMDESTGNIASDRGTVSSFVVARLQ